MARFIAPFSIAAVCFLTAFLQAQDSPKKKDAKPEGDTCTIPMTICVPSFKKNIEKETAPGSEIRKAAMKALSSVEVIKGTFKLKIGAEPLISEEVMIAPASGTVVVDGTTWRWKIAGVLGDVQIYRKEPPGFARFKFSPRFTISSTQGATQVVQVLSEETRARWFYIVYGGGPGQDATKRPKNAPGPDKLPRK